MKAKPLAVSLFFVAKHCKSTELNIFNKRLVIFYRKISYICKNHLHFKPQKHESIKRSTKFVLTMAWKSNSIAREPLSILTSIDGRNYFTNTNTAEDYETGKNFPHGTLASFPLRLWSMWRPTSRAALLRKSIRSATATTSACRTTSTWSSTIRACSSAWMTKKQSVNKFFSSWLPVRENGQFFLLRADFFIKNHKNILSERKKLVPLHPQKCVLRWLECYQYTDKEQLNLQMRSSSSSFLSDL